ncbi:SDR family oxidoreductase [Corallococcus llansteffanensis]|uniref:SDR family oxidoreductase n=1 Tax=Corallococcus llansteffanensis TaxID=2316731 RepID=A0A3A8Q4F7_9BACT|nr:SDR family oxidoreductase [Corallococcus llansteffanensis]RKH61800.1 SDR family oxidoreductase [Corallococcus llansteffanensis]
MFVVTGATGKLGQFVVEGLLKKVPASQVAVAVRDPDKAKAWAARGVRVHRVDYSQPASLEGVFSKGDTVLLISANEVGKRFPQHSAVTAAAKKAGVKLLAYTSILRADTTGIALAGEHKATEQTIRDSGVPFVFLRNGWYLENDTEQLAPALEYGVVQGSAKDGQLAAASREDFADAAVAVLTGTGHENRVYELAGDTAFTRSEYAAEVSRQSGKKVAYVDLPVPEYAAALVKVGLPKPFADILADADAGLARGELNDTSHTLSRLIGRPTTKLADAVGAALKAR